MVPEPSAPAEPSAPPEGEGPEGRVPAATLAPYSIGPLPPGYIWAPAVPPEPPPKAPRWLIPITALWAVVLLGSAIVYSLHGSDTVREQSSVSSAVPVVDRATTAVLIAAGSGPIASITPLSDLGSCRITPVRQGVDYQRVVTLAVPSGTESAVLRTVAAGLPASYHASSGPGAILDLHADAGDFVSVVGSSAVPGVIEVEISTGCRPLGSAVRGEPAPSLSASEMAPVAAALTALGLTPSGTSAASVTCPDGGTARTVSARVDPSQQPGPLDAALAAVATDPAVHGANLVAWRTGGTDVIARQDSDGLSVSATTRCQ